MIKAAEVTGAPAIARDFPQALRRRGHSKREAYALVRRVGSAGLRPSTDLARGQGGIEKIKGGPAFRRGGGSSVAKFITKKRILLRCSEAEDLRNPYR